MAHLRTSILHVSPPLAGLLQPLIELDLESAQPGLLTRALEICACQHGTQPSLSEILRLLQFLDARQSSTQPSHIEVRWVDPPQFDATEPQS